MSDKHTTTENSELTPKQELFCQYYTLKGETFGNGTLAYALAFNHDLENAPKNDAVYELPDGSHITHDEIEDKEFKENILVGKKRIVEDSSHSKMYNVCANGGSRLLIIPKVINRIDELNALALEDDREFDSKLRKIALKADDNTALSAIKHRNDLRGRIIKRTSADVTITENPLKGMSKEELLKIIATPEDEDTK